MTLQRSLKETITLLWRVSCFDSTTSSSDESGDGAPGAKRPCEDESWWEDESEGDVSGSEAPEGEVIYPLANEEAGGQLPSSLVHDGCGCHGANLFTDFQNVSILHFQEQLTSMSPREVDLYVMGLLAGRWAKSDSVDHHGPVAGARDRRRITFVYTCMGNLVCHVLFLNIHMIVPRV